jgi:hypothetical protein
LPRKADGRGGSTKIVWPSSKSIFTQGLFSLKVSESMPVNSITQYTDNKENEIFFIYKETQMGSVAKSYMRKGFLILYEEMKCANT